jgi:histidyl-tRNA synthetase
MPDRFNAGLVRNAENLTLELLERAGYRQLSTPIVEQEELYVRGFGSESDVATKEMFGFVDGGQRVVLRPEGTAGVVRALLERGVGGVAWPAKYCYAGLMFRRERAQAGRWRQFSQVGAEAFGVVDPLLDAEMIALAAQIVGALGVAELIVRINSLGCSICRPGYLSTLRAYLTENAAEVDALTDARIERNPLRVLDDKRAELAGVIAEAPTIEQSWCGECAASIDEVRAVLLAMGVPFVADPRLVRGLDYYCGTAFEIVQPGYEAAQTALAGGGRYDGLSELLGGPELAGVGFAVGIERVLRAGGVLENEQSTAGGVVCIGLDAQSRRRMAVMAAELRGEGVGAELAYASSLSRAITRADKAGAAICLIQGSRELEAGSVSVRDMATGEQSEIGVAEVVAYVTERART